jgi:FtsZ-binding cell division protein ZapB
MVTLEQVKLLETKVSHAIAFVEQLTREKTQAAEENARLTEEKTKVLGENARLVDENSLLKEKLDTYQKRIDELEVLIQRFKEDQGRIEEGILSALDQLNQFEAAVEKSIAPVSGKSRKQQNQAAPAVTAPKAAVPEVASPEASEADAPSASTPLAEVSAPKTPVSSGPEELPVVSEEEAAEIPLLYEEIEEPLIPVGEEIEETLIFESEEDFSGGSAGEGAVPAELDLF